MSNSKKIAFNSIALYANMVVTMSVTLLGTRFVLQALGREDYAIYALIANIVALFSFLNIAMAGATQRFLSYALGKGDTDEIKTIFYNSSIIHKFIALFSTTLLLVIGIPAIEFWLEIPPTTHAKAIAVLLSMIGGVVFIVCSVPYEATMNAHEDISIIAGINILEATLKLVASISVLYIPSHRLTIYAMLIMSATFVAFILKRRYCRKKYNECHYRWHKITNYSQLKNMTSFAGWNLIGTGCSISRYQGTAILLNHIFGLLYNAAYGVAQQVNGFLLFFASSAIRPMRPHIIKSEGSGRHDLTIKYSNFTSRITALLLSLVILPLFTNMPLILDLWLKEVPIGALEFCRGFLIITLIGQLSSGQITAIESVGKIKNQQLVIGIMHFLPLPIAYLLYKIGQPFYTIIYCIIAEEILCIIVRTIIARKDAKIPAKPFIFEHLIPTSLCIAITLLISQGVAHIINDEYLRLMASFLICILLLPALIYKFSFTKWEKEKTKTLFISLLSKIRR